MKRFVYILCMLSILSSGPVYTRDGCKEIGQACVCSNTQKKGYCFPSLLSPEGELYCDCQSDVLSNTETIMLMAKKYKKEKRVQQLVQKFYPETIPLLKELLTLHAQFVLAERSLTSRKTAVREKAEATQKKYQDLVDKITEKMVLTSTKTPTLASLFFRTYDCSYYGELCRCGNTGMEGICAIDRNPTSDRRDALYCHCGG